MSLTDKIAAISLIKPSIEESALSNQDNVIPNRLLMSTIEDMRRELQAWYDYGDQKLQDHLLSISSSVVDIKSAMTATYNYNTAWFATLPMSLSAKQEIASLLLSKAKEFGLEIGTDLWKDITLSLPQVMDEIVFRKVSGNV